MKINYTPRGFARIEFNDDGGNACSLQESSSGTRIWVGCNEIGLSAFTPYGEPESWKEYSREELLKLCGDGVTDVIANTRMHLSQKQVKALLPHLQKFAETGEL